MEEENYIKTQTVEFNNGTSTLAQRDLKIVSKILNSMQVRAVRATERQLEDAEKLIFGSTSFNKDELLYIKT